MADKRKPKYDRKKKLADDEYVKPTVTASDMLTAEEIKERMKNYVQVNKNDLHTLKIDDKIRYFESLDNNKYKYKPGGFLLVNGQPDYLVLVSSKGSWSVQLKNHVIFKGKDIDEIDEEYQIKIDELKKSLIWYRSYVNKLETLLRKNKIKF